MVGYLITGLTASMAHVLSGPDHLAAVTPLAIGNRNRAWLIGLSWGIGHTAGMLGIGIVFIIFRESIRMDLVTSYSDQLVGLVMAGIGICGLIRYNRNPEGIKHNQAKTKLHPALQSVGTALLVGVVHGLAGFSHLIAVLPTLALPSMTSSVAYLSSFGAGTLISMISFTWFLGRTACHLSQSRKSSLLKALTFLGCFLAIIVGILWMIKPFVF